MHFIAEMTPEEYNELPYTESEKLFKEALAKWLTTHDGYVGFSGWNCDEVGWDDEECEGWDGESRRCDCGNRRVYWEEYTRERTEEGHTKITFFAEAY